MSFSPPSIPVWLADRPTVGGLVVPWNTIRTADGRDLIGAVDQNRTRQALHQRLCGVCGRPLDLTFVFLIRLSDLALQCSAEPGLHSVCANYTINACPMIAGRLTHYRATPLKLDDAMQPGPDAEARRGAASEPWFSVWVPDYKVASVDGHLVASFADVKLLRIRPITWRFPGLC